MNTHCCWDIVGTTDCRLFKFVCEPSISNFTIHYLERRFCTRFPNEFVDINKTTVVDFLPLKVTRRARLKNDILNHRIILRFAFGIKVILELCICIRAAYVAKALIVEIILIFLAEGLRTNLTILTNCQKEVVGCIATLLSIRISVNEVNIHSLTCLWVLWYPSWFVYRRFALTV